MATPRYTRTEQLQTGIAARNAGAVGAALADELEGWQSRRDRELDLRAQEAGMQEGAAAGEQGQLGPQNPTTIRARAFQEGAMVAHQAALQTDIRANIERFQLETPDDPAAFQAKVDGLQEGLLQDADPRTTTFIRQRIADYGSRAGLQVLAQQQQKLRAQAIADLDVGVKGLIDDATTASFEGDVLMTEQRRQELYGLLDRGVAGGLLEPARAAELKTGFERDVTSQEVVGSFDRLLREKGDAEAVAAIRRWQATKPSEVGLGVDEHEGVTRQMIALKNRADSLAADERAKMTATLRAETMLRQGRISDAITVMKSGFAPDQKAIEQATADLNWLRSTGATDPTDLVQAAELSRDFNTALAIQGQVHQFRRMPTAQRAEQLNRLRAALTREGASAEEVQLFQALEQTNTQVSAQLERDPRGYLQGEGLMQDAPLDFSSAEKLMQSIGARGAGPDMGSQLTGEPTPVLTRAEAEQFATLYQQAGLEERVSLLGIVAGGAGDEAEATLKQLDAQGYKGMALMGELVRTGRGQLAREVMLGEQIRGAEKAITPTRASYQADLDDIAGSALLDWPEQRATYVEAALSKYAQLKASRGDATDVYEPKLFQQALEQVMPTAEFNGRRVLIPAEATPDSFKTWSRGLTDADFIQVAGAPVEGMAALVRRRGRLVELGNGRYGVALSSAADDRDRYLLNQSGDPFVLEYGKPGPRRPEPTRGRPNP